MEVNKMNKMITLALVLALMPALMASVFAGNQFTIDVETGYTDPYPVEPGQNFLLSLQVNNKGTEKVDAAYIELDPVYPFTVLENARKSASDLGGGGKKIVEYKMFVDSSAISTVYEIPVKVVYGSLSTVTKSVLVRVQGTPQFEIIDVKTNEINPGDRESLNIQVENTGTGTAKKMTATFTSSSEMIKPIFSGGSVYINEFGIGKKEWLKFDVLVDQDAEYGVYTGAVTLKYNDESGTNHTNTYNIGILISGEPRFDVVKSEINAKTRELEIEVIDSGTAKGVAIRGELWVNDKLIDTDYVTQIKIDKKSTLKFNAPVKETTGVLKLYYKGPDNKEFAQEEKIAWKPIGGANTILLLVGVAATVLLIWKKPWRKIKLFKKKK